MAKTGMGTRIFAGVGAAVFLLTASVATISVIWDAATNKNNSETTKTAETTDPNTNACAFELVEGKEILPAPAVFKPEGAVTELVKTDIAEGTGAEVKAGDCLIMKYYGTLASDGAKFDENFTEDKALKVQIGTGQVIEGWDEGVVGMKVGGTRRLVIPYAKAYKEAGRPPTIPEKADLVFEVKLLEIVKK